MELYEGMKIGGGAAFSVTVKGKVLVNELARQLGIPTKINRDLA